MLGSTLAAASSKSKKEGVLLDELLKVRFGTWYNKEIVTNKGGQFAETILKVK